MYCTPIETRKARKEHVCTYCGEAIEIRETYRRWASYAEGKAFANEMHPECLTFLQDESDGLGFEYALYDGARPEASGQ